MTTPLIREIIDASINGGGNPVDYVWFDISDVVVTKKNITIENVLKVCKPPFNKCIFVFRSIHIRK